MKYGDVEGVITWKESEHAQNMSTLALVVDALKAGQFGVAREVYNANTPEGMPKVISFTDHPELKSVVVVTDDKGGMHGVKFMEDGTVEEVPLKLKGEIKGESDLQRFIREQSAYEVGSPEYEAFGKKIKIESEGKETVTGADAPLPDTIRSYIEDSFGIEIPAGMTIGQFDKIFGNVKPENIDEEIQKEAIAMLMKNYRFIMEKDPAEQLKMLQDAEATIRKFRGLDVKGEKEKKGEGTEVITLPAWIKRKSVAVDYLIREHNMTRQQAFEWIKKND